MPNKVFGRQQVTPLSLNIWNDSDAFRIIEIFWDWSTSWCTQGLAWLQQLGCKRNTNHPSIPDCSCAWLEAGKKNGRWSYSWELLDTSGKNMSNMDNLPSRKLTYPPKMAFWRWFSFSQGGNMLIPWRVDLENAGTTSTGFCCVEFGHFSSSGHDGRLQPCVTGIEFFVRVGDGWSHGGFRNSKLKDEAWWDNGSDHRKQTLHI